jgi:proteic killer suppression protein
LDIYYRNNKLRRSCEEKREGVRAWGSQIAAKVLQRMGELAAAETLADLYLIPAAGCHQLKGDRCHRFAVNLKHPFRLVFEPEGEKTDFMEGNEVNREKVTSVKVLEVVDYHG